MSTSLPANPELEMALLGALLIDANAIWDVLGVGDEALFLNKFHQGIFCAIRDLARGDVTPDAITVAQQAGVDVGALLDMVRRVPSATHAVGYARQLSDLARRRALVLAAAKIAQAAYDLEQDDAYGVALREVEQAGHVGNAGGASLIDAPDAWPALVEHLEARRRGEYDLRRIPTGFPDIDKILDGGFRPGEVIYLAGRPGMGKTTLAEQIVDSAERAGLWPVFVSIEMPVLEGLLIRRASRWSGEAFASLETGEGIDAVVRGIARAYLGGVPDWVEALIHQEKFSEAARSIVAHGEAGRARYQDAPDAKILALPSFVRQLKARGEVDMLVVDYLQLASDTGTGDNEHLRVQAMSRSLKALARQAGIVVLALSQLSRDVERRNNKRPVLKDLRASGSLEQDADVVMFLYRESMYEDCGHDITEVIVAKNRNGATGTAELAFLAEGGPEFGSLTKWQPDDIEF